MGHRGVAPEVVVSSAEWLKQRDSLPREMMVYIEAEKTAVPTDKLVALAESMEMPPSDWEGPSGLMWPHETLELSFNSKESGAVWATSHSGRITVWQARRGTFERDQDGYPIVEPLPTMKEMAEMAISWMVTCGINPDRLEKDEDGVLGYRVFEMGQQVSRAMKDPDPRGGVQRVAHTLIFRQVVGDFPTSGNGDGGRVTVTINHGGKLAVFSSNVRDAEPFKVMLLLSIEEIEAALRDGCYWQKQYERMGKTFEIADISIYQFCGDDDRLGHFVPMFSIQGNSDGEEFSLSMPALKEHRSSFPEQTVSDE